MLKITAISMAGLAAGMGIFTFIYGEGFSYFSRDPAACVNCHIMQPQFDSWQKASHHTTAKCVDCHLPHDFIGKWISKAENGFWHSKGFTLQDFHEPIFIREKNRKILHENCIKCHEGLVHPIINSAGQSVNCLHCHQSAGHGETVGLGKYERNEAGPAARKGEL